MKRRKKSYSNLTDESLVVFIKEGNTSAFDELYSRYSNRLLYYFYRMLGNNREKANDFLQEIFMKLIEKPDRFNSEKLFKTWIFSVAHNMCKNEYRRLAIRKEVSSDFEPEILVDEPNSSIETKELITKIYSELNSFDDEHKSVFLLKYREGFQVKEISTILNLSEGTIKSRLFYTRKKLYERLKQCPELEYSYAM